MSVEPSTAITRRTYGATVSVELSRAAAEVADDERRVDQAEHRPQKERVAEQLAAQVIPSAGRGREELLRLRPAPRQHAAEPPFVLPCRRSSRPPAPESAATAAWRPSRDRPRGML